MRGRRHRPTARKRLLSDDELLASAWRDLSRAPTTYRGRNSSTRSPVRVAKFQGLCERCGSPIEVGQDIRFHNDFGAAVHDGCRPPKLTVRTKGAGASPPPHATTAKVAHAQPLLLCPHCHLEHAGECW